MISSFFKNKNKKFMFLYLFCEVHKVEKAKNNIFLMLRYVYESIKFKLKIKVGFLKSFVNIVEMFV